MIPMQKLLDAASKEYPSLSEAELTALIGLQIEARQQQMKDEMKRISKAKGGNISGQMEMFEEGGLKDEGNTVDPVSGNDVPPGSTQEEVRDDVPAQLSEGEFVFPADVVRYLGLEKLMQLRQEAKQGLKTMEDMGQMGNSEEATMPDDLPFDITDLDIEDDEEYNSEDKDMAQGGVVYAANGFAGQSPQGGFRYKPPTIPKKGKLKFKNLIGVDEKSAGGGADEYKTYINEAGAEIQVPFKDGKILVGYNIPEGYMLKTDKVDKAQSQSKKVQSTRVQSTDDGGDDTGVADLGGARTTIGGVEYAVQYNWDGTVGLASVQDYKTTGKANFNKVSPALADQIKTQAVGQVAELAKVAGLKGAAVSEIAKKFGVDLPGYRKVDAAIAKAKTIQKDFDRGLRPEDMFDMGKSYLDKEFADRSKEDKRGFEGLREKDMRSIQGGLQFGKGNQINKGLDDDFVDSLGDINKGITEDSFTSTAPTVPSDIGTSQNTTQVDSGSDDPSGGWDSGDDTSFSDSGYGDSSGSTGGIGDFNIGGLAGKKKQKIKVKKMKRGGLASR